LLKNEIIIERDPEVQPRWLRISAVKAAYGLNTVRIYELLNTGHLKSVLLRDKGKKRGIRLISVESLDEFFRKRATTKLEPMKVLAYHPDNPVRHPGRPRKQKAASIP
jgi:hypothetical protein